MPSGCWEWQGPVGSNGYGQFGKYLGGGRAARTATTIKAHRAFYEFYVGPIPADCELDHLCRNRLCVNPSHLEPVSHAENMRRTRGLRPAKASCSRGHTMSPDNTYTRPDDGRRECRECRRQANKRQRLKRKAQVSNLASWDDTKAITGGGGLLPKGVRVYDITKARVEVSTRGAKLRELVIGLADSEGHSGETTVALEPFDKSPRGVELWESLFKGAAQGLGFTPTAGHLPMVDIANEFASWVPTSGLVGSTVEAMVKHVESKPKPDGSHLKDDGTPFVNHRVTFRGIVGAAQAPAQPVQPVPVFAGANVNDDSDVWG